MLADIIRELTKCGEMLLYWVKLFWQGGKRMEAQRAQAAVINCLFESKNFDVITQKESRFRNTTCTSSTVITRKRCKYCRQIHKPGWCLVYGKRCDKCGKLNHFKVVCRGFQSRTFNTIAKEDIYVQESGMEMVNIDSISFNSNHSTKIAKLKHYLNKPQLRCHTTLTQVQWQYNAIQYIKKYSLTQQQIDWWQQKIQQHLQHTIAQ